MSKQIVKFLKTHGRYVKGDVAGFEPATIAKWPKGTCKPFDPEEVDSAPNADGEAGADVSAKLAELAQREADLKAREEALAEKEQAAEEAGKAGGEPAGAAEAASKGAKASGEPPKQGASK
ncbi:MULTISPECIES: hypothetical protein [unclassified Leisingera]|uniref:hypothetical protein n=1 Tax=unclassified Leisingera TaxID=2614906 RepID=UPI000317822B|nr:MULTISPECIES: hypothetical protein [unclassified Leisingera]KIC19625.1 hypothetical protein RA21_03785 [Leisingera sp. ANG-DT]KIC30057.1 hypothetical protein RA24_03705 [Leisingera sp. ANG-M6]KIC54495.1 hypothetical protein RA22_07620 [Leisingera sp. ANG-S]KID10684.1 hypothetical protein GC1_03135 [Leisingera sp. ANG1]